MPVLNALDNWLIIYPCVVSLTPNNKTSTPIYTPYPHPQDTHNILSFEVNVSCAEWLVNKWTRDVCRETYAQLKCILETDKLTGKMVAMFAKVVV